MTVYESNKRIGIIGIHQKKIDILDSQEALVGQSFFSRFLIFPLVFLHKFLLHYQK